MFKNIVFGLLLLLFVAATGRASLIAEWNFDNGTADDSVGTADLSAVGGGHTIDLGYAAADGAQASRHETSDPSDPAAWTVSLWVRTDTTNQGTFKGLFTNQTSAGAANSWQVDNHNGQFRTVGSAGASVAITSPGSGVGSPIADIWQHVVIQKTGGGVELFIDGRSVGTGAGNPGDLANYRLAINRNSDNQYAGRYDTVQVFDSAEDAAALFALGRHKIAKTRSWVAGGGGDVGGDNFLTAVVGGTDFDFGGATAVVTTGKRDVGFAYSAGATAPGGDAMFGASGTTSDATFEMWINATNTTGKHILFETGGNGTGTSIFLDGSTLTFQTQQGGANVRTLTTDIAGLTDRFLQLVGVIDFTGGGAADLTLYLNGNVVDTDAFGSGYTDWAGVDGTGLGTHSGTVTQDQQLTTTGAFDGQIGVLNYYNSALSAGTVKSLYNARAIPTPAALPAGLVGLGLFASRRRRR